jgi:hypothetical protein
VSTDVLGEGAPRRAEHGFSWLKPRHVPADGFDVPGQIDAGASHLRPADARHRPHDERAAHEVTVHGICGSRANPYQDLIVTRRRLFSVFAMKHVR